MYTTPPGKIKLNYTHKRGTKYLTLSMFCLCFEDASASIKWEIKFSFINQSKTWPCLLLGSLIYLIFLRKNSIIPKKSVSSILSVKFAFRYMLKILQLKRFCRNSFLSYIRTPKLDCEIWR